MLQLKRDVTISLHVLLGVYQNKLFVSLRFYITEITESMGQNACFNKFLAVSILGTIVRTVYPQINKGH